MEEMEQELLNLVYQASLDKKMIDCNDLKTIINSGLSLESFIKKIMVSSKDDKFYSSAIACYDQYNKKITIYKERLLSYFQKRYDKIDSLDTFSRYIYSNIYILEIVLHEAFHATHLKILKEIRKGKKDNLNLEETIISAYYDLFNKLYDKNANLRLWYILFDFYNQYDIVVLINKNRDIDPTETMSNISAYRISLDILKISEELSNIRKYYEYDILSNIINLYQTCSHPTLSFFKSMGRKDLLETLPFYDINHEKMLLNMFTDYDLATRITYGLTVAPKELKQLIKIRDSYNLK